jgi:hypothetical protein
MRAVLPEPFVTQLAAAPSDVQRVFWKQLRFLLRDLRHPSLSIDLLVRSLFKLGGSRQDLVRWARQSPSAPRVR